MNPLTKMTCPNDDDIGIKSLIQKVLDNQPSRWEDVVNGALLAQRTSVSSTTGYTPHFLLTGWELQMQMEKTLRVSNKHAIGSRLGDLATALNIARANAWLVSEWKTELNQGHSNNQSWRTTHKIVTCVRGRVVFLYHQRSRKTKVLNHERVSIVDPKPRWDQCCSCLKHKQVWTSWY